MVTSLDRFARRQPGLFMGAAVGLGFALSRLAKSTSEGRASPAPSRANAPTTAGTTAPAIGSAAGYTVGQGDLP